MKLELVDGASGGEILAQDKHAGAVRPIPD